jgi:hypothetical protein
MAMHEDYVELAEMMQNFFSAVQSRADVRVEEAMARLDAFHGETAALEAMIKACDAMREGEHETSRFWMTVYGQLISPSAGSPSLVTLH